MVAANIGGHSEIVGDAGLRFALDDSGLSPIVSGARMTIFLSLALSAPLPAPAPCRFSSGIA